MASASPWSRSPAEAGSPTCICEPDRSRPRSRASCRPPPPARPDRRNLGRRSGTRLCPCKPPPIPSEKRQGADLDAFARRRRGRCALVVEGGVGAPARPPVGGGIIDLEDQGLVAAHAREPYPAMGGVVFEHVDLADPIGEA